MTLLSSGKTMLVTAQALNPDSYYLLLLKYPYPKLDPITAGPEKKR